jgi:hypothetical protein
MSSTVWAILDYTYMYFICILKLLYRWKCPLSQAWILRGKYIIFLLGAHFVSSLYRATGVAEGWGHMKTKSSYHLYFWDSLRFGGSLCSACVLMSRLFDFVQFRTLTPFESAPTLLSGWVVSSHLKTIILIITCIFLRICVVVIVLYTIFHFHVVCGVIVHHISLQTEFH